MNLNIIINPLTNESLNIFSSAGKNLLKNYIKQYNKIGGMNAGGGGGDDNVNNGGGASNHTYSSNFQITYCGNA